MVQFESYFNHIYLNHIGAIEKQKIAHTQNLTIPRLPNQHCSRTEDIGPLLTLRLVGEAKIKKKI